jgi:hypothetical protein
MEIKQLSFFAAGFGGGCFEVPEKLVMKESQPERKATKD